MLHVEWVERRNAVKREANGRSFVMRTSMNHLAYILLCGIFLVSSATFATPADQDISDAVEDQILLDEAVWLNDIDVVTNDGIVTLTGKVDNVLARERSARLAETVRGVRAVVNRIEVSLVVERSDSAIRADIERALLVNPATESYEVGTRVDNGHVTLKGTVDSWSEARLAETVASGVRGVRSIDNRLSWDYETERADFEIESEIEQRLKWDVLIDERLIGVEVTDGVVELTGTVGSAAEKRRATSKAWVAGVNKVDESALAVRFDVDDPDVRRAAYVPVSDEEIADAVKDALLYDPRTLSFEVGVEVNNGIVTLRGSVDSLGAKRAAEMDARNTTGVISVANRLRIRMDEPVDDEVIERRVRNALLRDPYVERYEITVDAHNGIVDLYGTVDSYFEKGQADDVASRVEGVVLVDNNLAVDDANAPYAYDPYVDDWYPYDYRWYGFRPYLPLRTDAEIEDDIRSQLWWSPFVDSDEVNVEVDNGVATLTGTVDSWSELRAARENALEGGATWVINNLKVHRGEG